MNLNYSKLLAVATQATLRAGQEILRQYQEGYTTVIKKDGSPVTSADMAANDILLEAFEPTGIAIVSEESDRESHEYRQANPYWCIDPIDGTQDFVDKTDEFCVSVGLVTENTSNLGVLYAPALQLFYFAAKGIGSFKYVGKAADLEEKVNSENFQAWLMQNSIKLPAQKLPETPLFMASRYHRHPRVEEYIQKLKQQSPDLDLITMGSAIKLGLMAERKAKIYVRYTRFNFWDVAGGHAICKFAGLDLYQPHTQQLISYEREDMRIEGYEMEW